MRKVVLATGNVGKIEEIAAIFGDLNMEIVPQSDFGLESAEETGETFLENALLKAVYAANQSGLPAIADDSGIAVDVLGGRPGVWSARYAGQHATDGENLDLLLRDLGSVPDEKRVGGFHCAAVFVRSGDDKEPVVAQAVWRGTILRERRGTRGFGYDPVFFDPTIMKTGAEMSREEKNSISHRGKAFRKLRVLMQEAIDWM